MYLIGLDIGTTSVKAVVFDENGRRVSKAVEEYSLETPTQGIVELDAEIYWRSSVKAVKKAVKSISPGKIEALSVSSQGETLIPVNRDGEPLRKAIVWLDNRSKEEAEEIKSRFCEEEVYRVTGQPTIIPTWPATKILWIKKNEPEIFRETFKFLMVEDYLLYKLTSRFVSEPSVSSSTILLDIRRDRWWGEMLSYLGIDEDKLPEILPSGRIVGKISEQASEDMGLERDVVIGTGAFDQAASALGAGNISEGVVSESTGAALAIVATVQGLVYDPGRRIPLHRHASRSLYFLMPWCQIAGMLLKWFRDEFAYVENTVGKLSGIDAYRFLDMEAEKAPPGSEGLVILPHLSGAASPEFDPQARGVIFGLTLRHRRHHIIRAILESIGYMLRRNIELLEKLGIKVHEVRSIGGGARSRLWRQIKSDILQRPVLALLEEETACLGAAMLAGIASGIYRDLEDAVSHMALIKERTVPKRDNKETYDRLYRVYVELYDSLRGLFPKLVSST